uniref:Uncharacterized protein n=1 Tax=uncultured bacterium A1Q1_fos_962 TaxID=1256592 RepID=L7VYN6_9BACT|nr:hypothetical protein [uncultured bacterium A1Q1_fos_962]
MSHGDIISIRPLPAAKRISPAIFANRLSIQRPKGGENSMMQIPHFHCIMQSENTA